MAIDNTEISRNVEQVRNATYGKDVREAIAKGLEICYGYTSGATADEAAQRANAAEAAREVEAALQDIDDIVKVQDTQPSEASNKIWVQPQDDTEYKVASFAAYEALWNRMNEVNQTYEQGHGGIVSVEQDEDYSDPNDSLKRRFVITYSDNTIGEFFVNDGPEGPQGAVDQLTGVTMHYALQSPNDYTGTPPEAYDTTIPPLQSGHYLWAIAENRYLSGAQSYNVSLTRIGVDGSGAVNSISIGDNNEQMTQDVKLPVDIAPTPNSVNLIQSGPVWTALNVLDMAKAPLNSPGLIGQPTAPTPAPSDSSTKIATTAFVQNAIASVNSAAAIKVSLSMNSNDTTTTHTEASLITSNTAVLGFTNFTGGSFSSPLNWVTTDEGQLIVTTSTPPSAAVTFEAIIVEAY